MTGTRQARPAAKRLKSEKSEDIATVSLVSGCFAFELYDELNEWLRSLDALVSERMAENDRSPVCVCLQWKRTTMRKQDNGKMYTYGPATDMYMRIDA